MTVSPEKRDRVSYFFSPFVRGPINFPETPLTDFSHPVGHAWHVHMARKSSRPSRKPDLFLQQHHRPYYYNTTHEAQQKGPPPHEQQQQQPVVHVPTSTAPARAQPETGVEPEEGLALGRERRTQGQERRTRGAGGRTRGNNKEGPRVLRLVGTGGRDTGGHPTPEQVAVLDPHRIRLITLRTRVRQGFRLALKQTRKELWVKRNRPGDENYISVCENISADCEQVMTKHHC